TRTTSPRLPRLTTFSSRMTCMTLGPGSVVVVGVRQQGQEAGTLDRGVQLALIVCLRAGQASGDDLAVLLDEITQGVEILVVDLFNARCREAAELAALEQRILLGKPALPVLSFLESHDVCLLGIRAVPGECFYVHRASALERLVCLLYDCAAAAGK